MARSRGGPLLVPSSCSLRPRAVLAVGIAALLAFVALGSVRIVSSSFVEDRQVD
jgi:hypothetical protein